MSAPKEGIRISELSKGQYVGPYDGVVKDSWGKPVTTTYGQPIVSDGGFTKKDPWHKDDKKS